MAILGCNLDMSLYRDGLPQLSNGNPVEFGAHYRALLERFPQISVLGGCCGTDARHIRQIAEACAAH